MNEFHNRVEAIDELPILVPVFLELIPILFEELKDGAGSLAVLDLFGERIVV